MLACTQDKFIVCTTRSSTNFRLSSLCPANKFKKIIEKTEHFQRPFETFYTRIACQCNARITQISFPQFRFGLLWSVNSLAHLWPSLKALRDIVRTHTRCYWVFTVCSKNQFMYYWYCFTEILIVEFIMKVVESVYHHFAIWSWCHD